MTTSDRPRHPVLGAIAVLLQDGCALLVQRGKSPDRGLWGFPGGHVELGETAEAAALRELHEETGVTARSRGYLTNIDVIPRDPAGEVQAHYLLAAVLCDAAQGVPVAGDDAAAVAWVPIPTIYAGTLPLSARVAEVTRLAQTRRDWDA